MAPPRARPLLSGSTLHALRRLATGTPAPASAGAPPPEPPIHGDYEDVVAAYVRAARQLREEREAARSQAALNDVFLATSHDAFVAIDADGKIIAWNARAEEMFGWPAAVARGRSLARTIIPPAQRRAHNEGLRRFLETGEGRVFNRRLELTALHRDGTEFPVDMTITPLRTGDVYRFNAFITDATARRRAERHREVQHGVVLALAAAAGERDAVAGALEALGAGLDWQVACFWSLDRHGGVLRCGGAWHADALGLAAFAEASHALALEPGESLPGRALVRGEPIWIANVQRERGLPRRGAAARAGLLSAVCVPVRCEGELVGALELFSVDARRREDDLLAVLDATAAQLGQFVERKRAEAESDRLKGEFFALVSHELRTPLTSITGYAELLRDEPQLDEDCRRFVEVIERNAARLQRLLGDVLFVTQVEAGQLDLLLEPVALDALVLAAVEAAGPRAAEREIALTASVAALEPQLGDRDRLDQLLANLISNALKFTPPGGEVEVSLATHGDRVVLGVRDSGIGIPEEDQERLFERFYRAPEATARAIRGAGLGLTVAKAIVEGHGGRIAVSSRAGAGTSMRAELPARPAPVPLPAPVPAPVATPAAPTRRRAPARP